MILRLSPESYGFMDRNIGDDSSQYAATGCSGVSAPEVPLIPAGNTVIAANPAKETPALFGMPDTMLNHVLLSKTPVKDNMSIPFLRYQRSLVNSFFVSFF